MLKNKEIKNRNSEKGNVLFLILIAVALFAALSYAVTQSTRTGGGGSDGETALISSAQLTQYPASIRTSVVRMILGGVDVGDLEFNAPSQYTDCTAGFEYCVFHPTGGGATYASAPTNMMAASGGNTTGKWVYNADNQIDLLGISTGDDTPIVSTADLIAFLPGITDTLCSRINDELGLPTAAPTETGIEFTTEMVNDGSAPAICDSCNAGQTIGTGGGGADNTLDAQPYGCFNQGGTNVYFHVLVER